MMDSEQEGQPGGNVPYVPQTLNKTNESLAIRRAEAGASDYVVHLDAEQVRQLADAAAQGRHAERDRLLFITTFDGALRISETLGLRPCDVTQDNGGWVAAIMGKGHRPGLAAISAGLAAQVQAFCYRQGITPGAPIFPISGPRAFQIISKAYGLAGLPKPSKAHDRVGCVHVLRHSGAIERLKQTGNAKALQDQLRHKSAVMTLRYLKTLSAQESLKINQAVRFTW
jgi:integrase